MSDVIEVVEQGAQGDVLFRRIAALPKTGLKLVERGPQGHVVAHSETGHHHVVPEAAVAHFSSGDALLDFLEVPDTGATVIHLRNHDTHETLRLGGGSWEVRRQQEMTPEGWVQPVMD